MPGGRGREEAWCGGWGASPRGSDIVWCGVWYITFTPRQQIHTTTVYVNKRQTTLPTSQGGAGLPVARSPGKTWAPLNHLSRASGEGFR